MTQNKKRVIGITGNSGSGKTTVAQMLVDNYGAHAIDADEVVHSLMKPQQPAYNKIAAAFGPDILSDGKIDRKKLGAIVFKDTEKRTQLESIVHPIVIDEILKEVDSVGAGLVVIDAVLLVESGLHHHCDSIWLVTAPEVERLKRITTRDNLDDEAAKARMRNQRDTAQIAAIAQLIVGNDGDLDNIISQVQKFMSGVVA